MVSRFLNEVLTSLFLMRCTEGIVIHKGKKRLTWHKFSWEIDDNILIFTNKRTKKEYIIENLRNYKIHDDDYYVEFNKGDVIECWIEMM